MYTSELDFIQKLTMLLVPQIAPNKWFYAIKFQRNHHVGPHFGGLSLCLFVCFVWFLVICSFTRERKKTLDANPRKILPVSTKTLSLNPLTPKIS